MSDAWDESNSSGRAIGSISDWLARLFSFLPNPTSAVCSGRVDSPETTYVSLAAVAERIQPFPRTAPASCTQVSCGGSRRFTDGILAYVQSPGSPTSTAQSLFRLGRTSKISRTLRCSTQSNRRGTDPYARWCGRGGAARLPPIPINVLYIPLSRVVVQPSRAVDLSATMHRITRMPRIR